MILTTYFISCNNFSTSADVNDDIRINKKAKRKK